MTEAATAPPDRSGRSGRRRPFSTLMKKLANFKASSGDGTRNGGSKSKARQSANNNPYPLSGRIPNGNTNGNVNGNGNATPGRQSQYSVSTGPSALSSSAISDSRSESVRVSTEGRPPPTTGGRSMAPTVSTEHDAPRSLGTAASHGVSPSVAGTSCTAHGRRGGDSTFSSPAPSVRSLTTTLTTIQTVAPHAGGGGGGGGGSSNHTSASHATHHHHHLQANPNSQVIHFNQPFPTASPASAIPAHLTPSNSSTAGHPATMTYHTATANNLLTDNASILTLASSSKRGRRRSFDTDASVRALAPSSLWGGSRESLPLSVLSANIEGVPTTPGLHRAGTGGVGMSNAERASIYSATGILTASERNSFYAKQGLSSAAVGDSSSVRSGLLGHGRADSVTGSIGGFGLPVVTATPATASPLASQREGQVENGDGENVGAVNGTR
ncbi:hypothetical protein QBC35DRAFT_296631 [Podospora australis]|uniref:Uncharacterized protein n=1 Tax=Podospora australis TaxID=1536484 RepID=A0AAN7AHD9_9PEZI|nr:hypothetical protein QBC35DRAFT_296631 [Podospora australis]